MVPFEVCRTQTQPDSRRKMEVFGLSKEGMIEYAHMADIESCLNQ
jgi:hypothetical protein